MSVFRFCRKILTACSTCLAIAWSLPLLATEPNRPAWVEQVEPIYNDGQFVAAADKAVQTLDSSALAFAARAYLADVMSADLGTADISVVKKAQSAAERALLLDSSNVEARVQLAMSLGFVAMSMGNLEAHFKGVGKDVRRHLEAALTVAPEDPWAMSILGGWHMEVNRKAGGFQARLLYDANRDTGLALLEQALALDPDSIPIRQQFAALLIATKKQKHQERAKEVLSGTLELTPANAFEAAMYARCQDLWDALQSGDRKQAAKTAIRQIEIFN